MFADQNTQISLRQRRDFCSCKQRNKIIFAKGFSQTYHTSQNWIAYESLQNAAKLNTNQQIVDFPNDESPKEDYHNAFCQVRSFTPRERVNKNHFKLCQKAL